MPRARRLIDEEAEDVDEEVSGAPAEGRRANSDPRGRHHPGGCGAPADTFRVRKEPPRLMARARTPGASLRHLSPGERPRSGSPEWVTSWIPGPDGGYRRAGLSGLCRVRPRWHGRRRMSLRVSPRHPLRQAPPGRVFGSALTHPYITTDFSEALLQIITPALADKAEVLDPSGRSGSPIHAHCRRPRATYTPAS